MKTYTVYHGTNGRFNKFEQNKDRIQNDLYGGGVAYFADNLDVAKNYASTMSRRLGGDKIIYEVKLKMTKMFDVDTIYTGQELLDMIDGRFDEFARGAKLFRFGDDRLSVISDLKSGKLKLNGDQVFRGMSNGMVQTKRARERLIQLGFDGLRYNGGLVAGAPKHSVYLAYDARKIEILNRYIVSPKPVPSTELQDSYKFIN